MDWQYFDVGFSWPKVKVTLTLKLKMDPVNKLSSDCLAFFKLDNIIEQKTLIDFFCLSTINRYFGQSVEGQGHNEL